jgi:hypothetical protein
MSRASYERYELEWRGILIAVRHCPNWSEAHAQIMGHSVPLKMCNADIGFTAHIAL